MSLIIIFKQRGRIRSGLAIILTFAILNLTTGCSYFRVKEVDIESNQELQQQVDAFNSAEKYIVIHHQKKQYHLEDVNLNLEEKLLSGTIKELDSVHTYKKNPQIKRTYKYSPNKQDPLSEAHLYLRELKPVSIGDRIIIPLNNIESVGVSNKNIATSIAMVFFSVLGAMVLTGIIVALTKSSCPFIYSFDGTSYVFNGELYPGIIIPDAQRDDFLKLENPVEIEGSIKLLLTNELLEIQHTDHTELLVYDHPKGTEIALSPEGEPLVFYNSTPPLSSYTPMGTSLTDILNKRDELHYSFNGSTTRINDNKREVFLQFRKDPMVNEGKLLLRVKNSFWLDYIYGQMNAKIGLAYPEFQKRQLKVPAEESEKWMQENHLYLKVEVARGNSWEEVSRIPMVGPMAFRNIGIPFHIPDEDQDLLTIKVSSGFMFWDLDYAGIDFSTENIYSLKSVQPHSAITENGLEEVESLRYSDQNYLTQNGPGHHAEILFKIPEKTLYARSYYLKNRGYYTYIRNYSGIPDMNELRRFTEPGYFAEYSEREFHRIFEKTLSGEYLTENTADEN